MVGVKAPKMAAVSANVIHHHVKMQEQSDEESNDGSLHSVVGDKNDGSSPEYKPGTPEARIPQSYRPSEQPCDNSPETKPTNSLQNSPFSMHNVLKMKQERDSVSPSSVPCANPGVFSTEKLLENTPSYTRQLSPQTTDNQDRVAYSPTLSRRESCSLDEGSPRKMDQEPIKYRCQDNEEEAQRYRLEEGDENSCCSEDTVLSVGNEVQMTNFDSENRTSSTANSQILSPRSSPTPSPASAVQNSLNNLSSFKHIQSHLSAISQLSQNLHPGQHMLLRPNPITPNPLLFLNQNRLLFNPHHSLQPPIPQEQAHSNHQSLSPPMSRLSPNESPNRPPSPGCDKLNLMPNLSNFAVLGQQPFGPNLRYYKQMPFGSPMPLHMNQQAPILGNKGEDKGKIPTSNNGSIPLSSGGLFGCNKANSNLSADDPRHNLILNHNGLKFSIDNILKADFGRRITDPLHKRKSSAHKHKFAANSNANALQSPSKANFGSKESSFSGTSAKAVAFQPQSKDSSNSFYKNGPAVSNGVSSAPRLSAESRLSADLKTGSSLQNNLVTSSVSSGGSASEKSTGGNPIDLSKQDQEEKTTKGDGPMVWPAWVYCTRYSDRPSSGNTNNLLYK